MRIERRRDGLLPEVTYVKGTLMLRLAIQGQEQPADPRMRPADACLPVALAAFVLSLDAGAGMPAFERLLEPGRRL